MSCTLAAYSQTPELSFQEANRQFDLRNYDEAEKSYTRWLDDNAAHPLRAVSLFNLGLTHEKQSKWGQAIERYRQAMEISQKGSAEFKDALYRTFYCYEQLSD